MGPKAVNLWQWSRMAGQSSKFSSIPRRTFSTSPAWHKAGKKLLATLRIIANLLGVVPVFEKSSSTELDDLLTVIRETIIMPGYLSKTQQDLIYQPKHRQMLINDEVIANIGGEKFRLKYLDTQHVRPSPKRALIKAIKCFKDEDIAMLPRLLEGINKSHTKVMTRAQVVRLIIEKLMLGKREDILVQLMQQADSTGFRLRNEMCARIIMLKFLEKAQDSEGGQATSKALKWAETTLENLDDPKHAIGQSDLPDPRYEPEVIAPVVELAALQAKQSGDAEDLAKVDRYAQRLLSIWRNAPEAPADDKLGKLNTWLADTALTLCSASNAAAETLGSDSETAKELNKRASKLKEGATNAYNRIKGSEWGQEKERIGVEKYEKAFGADS
jgi:hypothetical protein